MNHLHTRCNSRLLPGCLNLWVYQTGAGAGAEVRGVCCFGRGGERLQLGILSLYIIFPLCRPLEFVCSVIVSGL